MPLIQSKSKKSFSKNVEAEMKSGKPQDQSLAIAYSVKRKNSRKKMAEGGEPGMFDKLKTRAKEEMSGLADAIKTGGTYVNTKDVDQKRKVEKVEQSSRSKYAEGGEVNESAKTERRPSPEETDKDAKSVIRNSMKKALVDSDATDNPTVKQAQKPSITRLSQPKIVGSDAFSVRNRDQRDENNDQIDSFYPESDKAQPKQRYNEEEPKRSGPEVSDMESQHNNKKSPYKKATEDQYSDDVAEADMKKTESPLGRYANGGTVSFEEAEQDNEPAVPGRKPNDMRPPQDEYMADHFAEGGMAHEFNDIPTEEADEEHYASIAAAIMAKKERQSKLISDSDIDEQINMYKGGQVPGSDESQVDIMSNGAEHPNAYYNRNENEVLKENYDSDMSDVSQPSDSNEHGDADETSSENEHDQDIISRIRAKMAVKRSFR